MSLLLLREFRENKLFYSVFIGFILVHILLIIGLRLLPFVDLPQHLAFATIYNHFEAPGNHFNEFFEFVRLSFRYNSLHPIMCSWDIWGNVENGNKVFFTLYIILLPVSVHLFIRKLGGNRWITLLTFLLMYNYSVSWGFVGFIISIPLYLLILKVHYEYLIEGLRSSAVFLPILFVLLYQMHLLSALLLLGLVLLQHFFFHLRSFKAMLLKGLIHLPAICLFGIQLMSNTSVKAPGSSHQSLLTYYKSAYWYSLPGRLKGVFYYDHHFLIEGFAGKLVGLIITLFILACILIPIKYRKLSVKTIFSDKRIVYVMSMICYFFLIYMTFWSIWGQGYTYPFRFNVLMFLSLIILGSLLHPEKISGAVKIILSLGCTVYLALWLHYFAAFQTECNEFNPAFFEGLPRDKVLSGLMYEANYRGQPIYIHFADYFVTWHHGIETLNLAYGYPTYGMKTIVSEDRLPRAFPWIGLYQDYNGHFDRSSYLLLRGKIPESDVPEFDENFAIIKRRGEWTLMKNHIY